MNLLHTVRHFKTQDNVELRFGSGDRDIPILPGQKVSKELIDAIMNARPTLCVETGLCRTSMTLDLIQQATRLLDQRISIAEFKERMGGPLQGLTIEEIRSVYPQVINPADLWRLPANTGVEDITTFLTRIERGLDLICEQASKSILLVAHAGTIKGIRAVLSNGTLIQKTEILLNPPAKNGEITTFNLLERRWRRN